jgi:short-subunit dehydrogenase
MKPLKSIGTAFITGASSGMGKAFAHELASKGYNLILVSKEKEKLDAASEEIINKYGIDVKAYPTDLGNDNEICRIEKMIYSLKDLEIVVNAAGFGTKGSFANVEINKSVAMINVHVTASTRFTYAALQVMIPKKKGAIINIASGAAYLHTAAWAVYNASKIYLTSFTKSLSYELKGTGIKVQALCPGMTRTGFHHTKEFTFDTTKVHDVFWHTPEKVAKKSLKALSKNKLIYIPGLLNKFIWGRGIFTPITSRVSTQMNK